MKPRPGRAVVLTTEPPVGETPESALDGAALVTETLYSIYRRLRRETPEKLPESLRNWPVNGSDASVKS